MTTCPKCGSADQIRKVSAICATDTSVSSSTSKTAAAGLTLEGRIGIGAARTSTAGRQQTLLGQKLGPPPRPSQTPGPTRSASWIVIITGVLLTLAPVYILLPIQTSSDERFGFVASAVGGVVLLVAGVLTLRTAINKANGWRANAEAREAAWKQAAEKWNRSYYCFRDDVVFDPESGDCAGADSFAAFLGRYKGPGAS